MAGSLRDIFDVPDSAKRTLLTEENAPALVRWAKEASRQAGLKTAPEIYILEHDLPNAYAAHYRSGAPSTVWVTEGALKRVFNSPNLSTHVPDGLKAIIGHEFSHIADGGAAHYDKKRMPLFLMPLITLAGYELYKMAKQRQREDPAKSLGEHLNEVTEDEKKKSQARDPKRYKEWEGPMLDWSNRLVAMDVGLIGGGVISNRMAIASELRADRMGVTVSGNPEAFIETMDKLKKAMAESIGPKMKEWEKTVGQRKFMENAAQLYDMAKLIIKEMTFGAHPSDKARFAAIRKFGAEKGMIVVQHL